MPEKIQELKLKITNRDWHCYGKRKQCLKEDIMKYTIENLLHNCVDKPGPNILIKLVLILCMVQRELEWSFTIHAHCNVYHLYG